MGELAPSTKPAIASLDEVAGVAGDASEAVETLAKQIRGFGSAQFDVEQSTNSFYDAVDALKANLDSGNASLDQTKESGRDTSAAMLEMASSTNDNAAAIAAMGGSTEAIASKLNDGRQRIIDTRVALGDTEEAARAYADKLIATPTAIQTQITLLGADEAKSKLQGVQDAAARLRDIILGMPVFGGSPGQGSGMADGGTLDFYANGGMRENHVAQIAPAGSWRVWAEPETGGEAYIPLGRSKRVRALQVWQETGKRLGVCGFASGGMQPASVQYAQGQTVHVATPASYLGGDTNIEVHSTNQDPSRLAREVVREVKWEIR